MKRIITLLFFIIFATQAQAYTVVKNNALYIPNPSKSQAVSLGKIYVGNPDTDPTVVANQKTIYVQDEAGTITAVSQPLTLGAGGVPLYNGDPVTLLTDGDYSLTVTTAAGVQLYHIPYGQDATVVATTIAGLRASPASGESIQVLGYYAKGDGGGGPLRVLLTAPSGGLTDNGGSIIKPGGALGDAIAEGASYWGWEHSGPIYAAWFGWSTSATAAVNTAVLNRAADSLGTRGGTLKLGRGDYAVAPGIVPGRRGVIYEGEGSSYGYEVRDGQGTRLIFTAGTVGFDFTMLGSDATDSNYSKLYNLTIHGNGVLETGVSIKGAKILDQTTVRGCTVTGVLLADYVNQTVIQNSAVFGNTGWGVIVGPGTALGNTVWSIKNTNIRQNTLGGLYLTGGLGGAVEDSVLESNTGYGLEVYQPTGIAVYRTVFNRTYIENNNTGTTGFNVYIHAQTAGYANAPSELIFKECTINALAAGDKHLHIANGNRLQFIHSVFSGGDSANAILVDAGVTDTLFDKIYGAGVITDNGTTTNIIEIANSTSFSFNKIASANTYNVTSAKKLVSTSYSVNTQAVSTTATILTGTSFGGLVTVTGFRTDSGAFFVDLLLIGRQNVNVVSSMETYGTPAARTYAMGTENVLTLAMAADAYDIGVDVLAMANPN